jgi:hypothetical protein
MGNDHAYSQQDRLFYDFTTCKQGETVHLIIKKICLEVTIGLLLKLQGIVYEQKCTVEFFSSLNMQNSRG